MKHRHIDSDDKILTVAAIESILERGTDAEVMALMRRLKDEPHSQSADNALIAAENTNVYGISTMIKECIQRWRESNGIKP